MMKEKFVYPLCIAGILLFCMIQPIFAGPKKDAPRDRDSLVISVGSGVTGGNYDPCRG